MGQMMHLYTAGDDVIICISNFTKIIKTPTESINAGHTEDKYVIIITCLRHHIIYNIIRAVRRNIDSENHCFIVLLHAT